MSHYLQYQQQQQHIQHQSSQQIYPDKQQHQQQPQQQRQQYESSQTMTYYNNLQIPMMFGVPTVQNSGNSNAEYSTAAISSNLGNESSIEIGYSSNYLNGLGLNLPSTSSASTTQEVSSSDCNHSSLISIRRDSGFAHTSLDEMSVGIMSSNAATASRQAASRQAFKGGLASSQAEPHNFNSGNPSFLLSSQSSSTNATTDVEGSTPIVPSMSNGIDYILDNVQRMLLVPQPHSHTQQQQQQQQHHPVTSASSPSSHGSHTTGSWGISSTPSQLTTFPSSPNSSSSQNVYGNNNLMSAVYGMQQQQQQQQQTMVASQQASSQQPLMSPLQYHPRHGQIQRPRQRKPQLQIMTEAEIGQQTPLAASSFSTPSVHWESSSYDMTHPSSLPVTSPSMSAANNIVQAGQQGYPWGVVSSPVESSFSSGTSTPLFASPSSSYAHSEMAVSCESSRAASPSFPHLNAYDAYLSDRRTKRMESDGSSSLIIRSRKSSTSSTSSMGSQRRTSNLRESSTCGTSPSSPRTHQVTSTTSPTHQCPQCGQCFAGPAVLVRHIESIHDKLMWNCVGCKSNLSRRDAVTRHINLSPMDSVCRAVGTIGQVKTSNGVEVHYEVSSYRAKPLDEVMSRMGKKISTALRKEIDRSKAAMQMREAAANALAPMTSNGANQESSLYENNSFGQITSGSEEMELHSSDEEEGVDGLNEDGSNKKRRRPLLTDDAILGRNKK